MVQVSNGKNTISLPLLVGLASAMNRELKVIHPSALTCALNNPNLCKECLSNCKSFAECKKIQFKNYVQQEQERIKTKAVLNAKGLPNIAFSGKKDYMKPVHNENYKQVQFDENTPWGNRFITITFDPNKFGANFLSQPQTCKNYVFNVLNELKPLFDKMVFVFETHKSGIIHAHLSYKVKSADTDVDEAQLELATLKLRLKYYFSKSLKNKKCIHDRIFNEGGKQYMTKTNKSYYKFA